MEINIVEELVKLRASVLGSVNTNPLPATIKIMVVEELLTALRPSAEAEMKQAILNMNKKISDSAETNTGGTVTYNE